MKNEEFLKWYSEILREQKKQGLKVEDTPEEVAKSALALHQKALLVYWEERKKKMPFNSKLWSARNNPQFEILDGDDSVRAYLSQFAHKGCGGAPEKGLYEIRCSSCAQTWKWFKGTLGEIIKNLPFKSMVIK